MYGVLVDDNNKIIGYYPTTYRFIKAEFERPTPKIIKPGVEYVEYWDDKTNKPIIKDQERPLTSDEKIEKALHEAIDAKRRAQAALQGLAAVTEGMAEPTSTGGGNV